MILLLSVSFACDMPLLAVWGWWEERGRGVKEMGKEERSGGGGSPSPGELGQALIFSL